MHLLRSAWVTLVLSPVLALAPGPVIGQSAERWSVEQSAEDGSGETQPIAVVLSPSGDQLRVHRRKDGAVALGLGLRPGFERLDPATCPTVRIDTDPPLAGDGRCRVSDRVAVLPLGRIEDAVIRSPALVRLMDGTRLVWRVRLADLGYREIAFTLRGSRQALVAVVGSRTTVER